MGRQARTARWLVALLCRCSLVLLVALAWAPTALAQASEGDTATARALAKEAFAAYDDGEFAKAAELFERAEKLHYAPTLLLGLARSQVKLGQYVEARENYHRIVNHQLPAGASPAFREALETAKAEVATLDDKIAWVIIIVQGPANPEVALDGTAISTASLSVKRAVNPGMHKVTAEASGARGESTFVVRAGESTEVRLTLQSVANAPADSETEATTPSGTTSTSGDEPDAVDPGATQRLLGFLALGVGGAGVAVGAITGGIAMGQHSELSDVCPNEQCPLAQESDLDAYNTTSTVSTVGFVAGGALAALGLVLVLTAPSEPEEQASEQHGLTTPPLAELRIGAGQIRASLRF